MRRSHTRCRPRRNLLEQAQQLMACHRLQLDVKFLERIPRTQKRLYQFTAIDDCTRLRVLKVSKAFTTVTPLDNFVAPRLPDPKAQTLHPTRNITSRWQHARCVLAPRGGPLPRSVAVSDRRV